MESHIVCSVDEIDKIISARVSDGRLFLNVRKWPHEDIAIVGLCRENVGIPRCVNHRLLNVPICLQPLIACDHSAGDWLDKECKLILRGIIIDLCRFGGPCNRNGVAHRCIRLAEVAMRHRERGTAAGYCHVDHTVVALKEIARGSFAGGTRVSGSEFLGDRSTTSVSDNATLLGLEQLCRHLELFRVDPLHIVKLALLAAAAIGATAKGHRPFHCAQVKVDARAEGGLRLVSTRSHGDWRIPLRLRSLVVEVVLP